MSFKQTCSICQEDFDLVAYANCRHFMCAACCWTLRGIVGDCKCPICRVELSWVVLSRYPFPEFETEEELKKLLTNPPSTAFFIISEINVYGNKQDIETATIIRAPQCTQCKLTFDSVHSMSKHHNEAHKLRFCYVCVEYLKKLPKDYELYRSSELSVHLHSHPNCSLCDKYVLNESVLRSHRKTSHFQCEVCDLTKKVSVFNSHNELSIHFKNYHFLCEYGECLRFGLSVFASKIEYNRHLVQQHASMFNKEERKRLLDFSNIDFMQYSQPHEQINNRYSSSSNNILTAPTTNRNNQRNIIDIVNEMRIAEDETSNQHRLILNDDNFPHLNPSSRRIEANLPLVNQPVMRFTQNTNITTRNRIVFAYPTIESLPVNEFPDFPISNVSESGNKSIVASKKTPITPANKAPIRNGNISLTSTTTVQEDFPSFPISKAPTFPGETNFWDKGPKLSKPKTQQLQPVSTHMPPKNALAYSLGVRNLDVTTKNNNKRNKKKKKPKSSAAQPIKNTIKTDDNEFPSLNSDSADKAYLSTLKSDNSPNTTSEDDPSLYEMVKTACNNNDAILANFMKICANFARGQLTAIEFHRKAIEIVGDKQYNTLLPKLAGEMPDESKARSLINLQNNSVNSNNNKNS